MMYIATVRLNSFAPVSMILRQSGTISAVVSSAAIAASFEDVAEGAVGVAKVVAVVEEGVTSLTNAPITPRLVTRRNSNGFDEFEAVLSSGYK